MSTTTETSSEITTQIATTMEEIVNTSIENAAETSVKKRGRKSKTDATTTTEAVEEANPVKVKKEKKEKPLKNFGFQVPSTKDREYNSTRFCKYIYDTIKEAKPELLSVEKVRDAYNDLIAFMKSCFGELHTYAPPKSEKYSGYTFSKGLSGYNSLGGIKGSFNVSYMVNNTHYNSQPQYAERIKKCKEQTEELTQLWCILYNLTYPEMSAYLIELNAKLTLKLSEEALKKEITSYKSSIIDRSKEIERMAVQIESYKKTLIEKEGKLAQLIVNAKRNAIN